MHQCQLSPGICQQESGTFSQTCQSGSEQKVTQQFSRPGTNRPKHCQLGIYLQSEGAERAIAVRLRSLDAFHCIMCSISAMKRRERVGVSGTVASVCMETEHPVLTWLLLSCSAMPALISPVSSLRCRFCRSAHIEVDCAV